MGIESAFVSGGWACTRKFQYHDIIQAKGEVMHYGYKVLYCTMYMVVAACIECDLIEVCMGIPPGSYDRHMMESRTNFTPSLSCFTQLAEGGEK